MKHQLKPNTYTICESTEQCKELFEWAKANTDFDCTEDFYDEDIILFYGEDRIVAMRNSEACTDDGDTLVLLPEFISRLKGEWVEGKTVTLSDAEWSNVFSCLDYHGTNDTKAILIKIKEQLNNQ